MKQTNCFVISGRELLFVKDNIQKTDQQYQVNTGVLKGGIYVVSIKTDTSLQNIQFSVLK